jgi:VCBS repeat-containing protein
MWLKARFAGLFVVVILVLLHASALFSQTYLSADGHTDTYGLITSKLAPGANPIEVPDASHPAGSPHIRQILDPDLGHYVFQFQIHLVQVTPTPIDDDPSTGDTDRQRNEIKTYDQSPEYLKAYTGDTVTYRWKFKLDAGFQPSPKFTHIHQIKPVDGNDSTPVITYLPVVSGGSNVMQLRYYDDSSNSPPPLSLKQVPLAPFLGAWIEANEKITFGTHGSYAMSVTRVSDGAVLLSYSNSDINLLRTGASFYRPKWGIYRSVEQPTYLRDENVLFDNFCLAKATDDCSAVADFDVSTIPQTQSVTAGGNAAYTATVTPNHGFNGGVAMSVSGLPAGTTASFDQATVLGAGSSQVKLATTKATPPGTYTVTVSGTSGALTHNSTITLQVTSPPDFALFVTPPSQTVIAGDGSSYTATVTPSDGFSGVVTFGVSGAPDRTTARFDNDSVTGTGSVHLNVATTASVSPGNYPLTVTATSDTLSHSGSVSLVIAGQPSFAMALTPSLQSVSAGRSATYTVTITPSNGFNAAVTFTCSGLPSEAQCVFSPQSVTPDQSAISSTLTITTTAPTMARFGASPFWVVLMVSMPVLIVFPNSALRGKRRGRKMIPALFVLFVASTILSCGGGASPKSGGSTPRGGTPAGTYSVTINAMSGSLQSSSLVGLTVTQ